MLRIVPGWVSSPPPMASQACTRASQAFSDTEKILLSDEKGPVHVQPSSTSGSKLLFLAAGPDHVGWRPEWLVPRLGVQFLFLHVHCDGLNCVSQYPPPSEALFENKVFTEAIQLQ